MHSTRPSAAGRIVAERQQTGLFAGIHVTEGYAVDARRGRFYTNLEDEDRTVAVDLKTPGPPPIDEFDRGQAPIPALGFIARYYVVPNISITGEVTAFKLPTVQNSYSGHAVDVDIYGTVNLINNFGLQAGYRSMDFGFIAKQDSGAFTYSGIYIAAVVRY